MRARRWGSGTLGAKTKPGTNILLQEFNKTPSGSLAFSPEGCIFGLRSELFHMLILLISSDHKFGSRQLLYTEIALKELRPWEINVQEKETA